MPARIEPTDLTRIVENLARQGKPAPGWVTDDPKLDAAYRKAAAHQPAEGSPAGRRQAATPGEATHAPKPPAAPRPQASARTGAPARKPSRPRRPRTTSARRAPRPAGPVPLPRVLTKAAGGSAAGGLFLAIFLYPIASAMLKNGPAGLGMWLKAKFLNKVTEPPTVVPFEHQNNPKKAPAQPLSQAAQSEAGSLGKLYGQKPAAPPAPTDPSLSQSAQSEVGALGGLYGARPPTVYAPPDPQWGTPAAGVAA